MVRKKEVNGEAIAKSMFEMAKLKVPTIAIIIGEGSSGGALAIGVANKVYMLENAVYSILSPEGYSSILWKDSTRYKEAAEKMKLTAEDLFKFNVVDRIIEEQEYTNETDKEEIDVKSEESFEKITENIKNYILKDIKEMSKMSEEEIIENRYQKFRMISEFKNV